MQTQTKGTQDALLPADAPQLLKDASASFKASRREDRDLIRQVHETCEGQFPFAAILSCIDSRTSAELIFDQGLGDIFNARIAGNFISDNILGSLEFACHVAGEDESQWQH